MEFTNLGNTGLRVSRLCLGMMSYGRKEWLPWVLTEDLAEPIIRAAVDKGITFYDTADAYSNGASETITGRVLRKLLPREEAVVATKVFFPMSSAENSGGLSRKHLLAAIDSSLERLGMDYVDLYQVHRWDVRTPIEETMDTLNDIVRAGKVRYIGASNLTAWQFAKAQHVAEKNSWAHFVSVQIQYNLLYREEEREVIPQCSDQGIGVIAYSPLARGLLAGNRTRQGEYQTIRSANDAIAAKNYALEADFDVVDRVKELAGERQRSSAQVALAWLLHQRDVTAPIIGATKMSHLEEAVEAEEMELSEEEVGRLEEGYLPHSMIQYQ